MFELLSEFFSQIVLVFALHLSGGSFPKPLSAKDEQLYFARAKKGDNSAREKLIVHNLRLVAHISKKYYAAHMEPDDLISIGTIGLIKSIDSFNPDKGTRFATYAARCIENEILMTFRALKKEQNTIMLGDTLGTDTDGDAVTVMDLLSCECEVLSEIEFMQDSERLKKALGCLSEQEAQVIALRYGTAGGAPMPQREAAARMGISRSYVSRIEKRALTKLRAKMDG